MRGGRYSKKRAQVAAEVLPKAVLGDVEQQVALDHGQGLRVGKLARDHQNVANQAGTNEVDSGNHLVGRQVGTTQIQQDGVKGFAA